METVGILTQIIQKSNKALIDKIGNLCEINEQELDTMRKDFLKPAYYTPTVVKFKKNQGVQFSVDDNYLSIFICQAYFKKLDSQFNNYFSKVADKLYFTDYVGVETPETFTNMLFPRNSLKKIKSLKRDREAPACHRCLARVWNHVTKEYSQCKKSKNHGNDFCKFHEIKQNYGKIEID